MKNSGIKKIIAVVTVVTVRCVIRSSYKSTKIDDKNLIKGINSHAHYHFFCNTFLEDVNIEFHLG